MVQSTKEQIDFYIQNKEQIEFYIQNKELIDFYIQNKDEIKANKVNPFVQMNEDMNKRNKAIQEALQNHTWNDPANDVWDNAY